MSSCVAPGKRVTSVRAQRALPLHHPSGWRTPPSRLRSVAREKGSFRNEIEMRDGLPPAEWLSRSLRGLCREENAPAEQVEAGAPVHLPLDQLEPSDLALRLAAAPGRRECRPDGGPVLLQPRRKGLESTDPTRSGVGQ